MHVTMLNVSCYIQLCTMYTAWLLCSYLKKKAQFVLNDRSHELLLRVHFMWSVVPQLKMIIIVLDAVYEEKSRDIVCYTSCIMLA